MGFGGYNGPIIIIYGTQDWVHRLDNKCADLIIRENRFEESKIYLVDDSKHNIMCDQNEEICDIILNSMEG
jgi:pimeloyl-ACP methyl ester carboxylesterase